MSFCAVGDAYTDVAPLQITDFAAGGKLDTMITKIYLEGFGGGNDHETYELAAWYYARRCKLQGAVLPILFFLGDELFYPKVSAKHIESVIGVPFEDCATTMVFEELKHKFNVFFLKKPYGGDPPLDRKVGEQWESLLGPGRVIYLPNEPKMVVDVILGVIAMLSGARTLESYVQDMKDRGQSARRVTEVVRSLERVNLQAQPVVTGDGGQIQAKSCGGVVFRRTPQGGHEVLLLQHVNGKHWDSPKGLVKSGEREEETAAREIMEETSLPVARFAPEFRATVQYSPCPGVVKDVVYFLAEVSPDAAIRVQDKEVMQYAWRDLDGAIELATFESSKDVLRKAKAHLLYQ